MKTAVQKVLYVMRDKLDMAKLAVLAQDRFSREDIAFYTFQKFIEPEDRRFILACHKKIYHHPIRYTMEYHIALV